VFFQKIERPVGLLDRLVLSEFPPCSIVRKADPDQVVVAAVEAPESAEALPPFTRDKAGVGASVEMPFPYVLGSVTGAAKNLRDPDFAFWQAYVVARDSVLMGITAG
jgi:hypothetical protein